MNNFLRFLFIFLLIEIFFVANFSFFSYLLLIFFIIYETFKNTKKLRKIFEVLFIAFIFFILVKDYPSFHFHLFALIFALIFSTFLYSLKTNTNSYYFPLLYFLFLIFYKNKMPFFFEGIFIYFSLVLILEKIFQLEKYQKYLLSFLIIEILIPISFLSLPEEIKALIAFLILFGFSKIYFYDNFALKRSRYLLRSSK